MSRDDYLDFSTAGQGVLAQGLARDCRRQLSLSTAKPFPREDSGRRFELPSPHIGTSHGVGRRRCNSARQSPANQGDRSETETDALQGPGPVLDQLGLACYWSCRLVRVVGAGGPRGRVRPTEHRARDVRVVAARAVTSRDRRCNRSARVVCRPSAVTGTNEGGADTTRVGRLQHSGRCDQGAVRARGAVSAGTCERRDSASR